MSNNISEQLSKYPGAVSKISTETGFSTDKIYRVLRGSQEKDKNLILIACADFIANERKLEQLANEKIAAL